MKPPSKPFFVEVRRSRSIPAQASPPARPTSSWEDAPEPAGARSKAWQHAEQFFQPRAAEPGPSEQEPLAPVEPVPIPAQAVVEPKDETAHVEARDGKGDKNTVKRSRKMAKAPLLPPEEARVIPVRKARRSKASQEEHPPVHSQLAPDVAPGNDPEPPSSNLPEEVKAAPRKKAPASETPLDEVSSEDAAEAGARRPLSARAARSAAKPAERWTCRLRHVRRNLGSGRIGQLRP